MEYCIASRAAVAGKKALTATSLFSFFLSMKYVKVTTGKFCGNKVQKPKVKYALLKVKHKMVKDTVFKEATDFRKAVRG